MIRRCRSKHAFDALGKYQSLMSLMQAESNKSIIHKLTTEHPKWILISYFWGCSQVPSNWFSGKKHFFSPELLDAGWQRIADADCQSTFKDSDQSCQGVWDTSSTGYWRSGVWGPTKSICSCSVHDWLSNCERSATLNLCCAVAQLAISLLCS